ncbi:unnamed protein product [Phytophthora fragariaefolia]|uniref:Unnamed protein product n=1 Tax=Phytophthora fragariaefolia TaxID=1490495 RepID=A0A9W6WX14_9STRA|nr:unnamed protein product [Phytophthora fragariaefolia]
MMTANFKGNAAVWYMLCRDSISDVPDLIQKFTKEFVPPDLQERLRDRLYSVKQKRCSSLEDYISRFRVAIMQVKEMSELDKITRWTPPRSFGRSNSTSFARANTSPQRPAENEPEPMEIDTGHVRNPRRGNYRRPVQNNNRNSGKPKKCRYCKKPGHTIEQCFKLQNRQKQGTNNSYQSDTKRGQFAAHTLAAEKPESVEVVEINDLNPATIQSLSPPNELIRKPGLCEGKRVTIMLDTRATCNVIRPGLVDTIPDTLISQVTLFDGSTTKKRTVHKGKVTIEMDGYRFRDLEVMDCARWKCLVLSSKPKSSAMTMMRFYRVKITPAQPVTEEPQEFVPLLDEFADVFLDALPDGLPPHRRVEFELNMKSDVVPSTRAPFRLSKTE